MRRAIVAAVAVGCAGCAPAADTASPTSTLDVTVPAPTVPTESVSSTSTTLPPDANTAGTSGAGSAEPPAVSTTSTGSPPAVEVKAAGLPVEITSAIASGGGELATTEAWQRRFGDVGLPVVAGDEVRLVEAELEATRVDGSWRRVDALQWLFTSPTETTVDEYLTDLAADAGLAEIDPLTDSETVEGAECVTRTYDAAPVGWVLQGCAFPQVDSQLRSVGVLRTTVDGQTPRDVHPSMRAVLDELGAAVDTVAVTFGSPAPSSNSTLRITVEATAQQPAAESVPVLAAGALAGWISEPGEGGATLFLGAPGESWMVFGDRARFVSEGRLEP